MNTKPIANNLREYRTRVGLRQIDVAERLGLDYADRLSRWENGLNLPSIMNLFKLSILYKTSPERLYSELYQSIETNERRRLV